MTKQELKDAVDAAKAETKTVLETVYVALNNGQRKQLLKNEQVKKQFDRFGVNYDQT